jgi:hypothetical protein
VDKWHFAVRRRIKGLRRSPQQMQAAAALFEHQGRIKKTGNLSTNYSENSFLDQRNIENNQEAKSQARQAQI